MWGEIGTQEVEDAVSLLLTNSEVCQAHGFIINQMEPIIFLDNVTFRYPGEENTRDILRGLSLEIFPGDMVAVVGSNGSGKTTMLRLMNGLLIPQSGRVLVNGLDTSRKEQLAAIRRQVGLVFQHPEDQIVATTVDEDVAFGPENLGLPSAEIRARVDQALKSVGLEEHAQRSPHMLSGGQTQRLALAGVLAMRPQVVLFDEATTMLDPAGRLMAIREMLRLNQEGMAVVFITHHMEEAVMASRVVVLHEGKVAEDGSPAEVFTDANRVGKYGLGLPRPARLAERFQQWLGVMTPRPLHPQEWLDRLPVYPGPVSGIAPSLAGSAALGSDEALIEVRGLEHTYLADTPLAHLALKDLNMTAMRGGTLGLLGRTGSGKSTLLQHLNGLLRPQKGSVRVGVHQLADLTVPTKTVAKMVGLVFQNPEMQFFEQYVGDEISYGPRQIGIEETLAERVKWSMELVGLDFEAFKDRLVFALSGGEKRKVALAATLALRPQVLLLDEPTAGLDPAAHLEVLGRLSSLQSEGMTTVLSSHRMNDLAALASRLAVFEHGTVIREGPVGEVFWDFKGLAEAGLEPPLVVRTAARLQEQGWPIPKGIVTPDALADALRACSPGGTQ